MRKSLMLWQTFADWGFPNKKKLKDSDPEKVTVLVFEIIVAFCSYMGLLRLLF